MAITNLNNVHLSEAQVDVSKDALTALEDSLSIIDVSLTPADRQKYGSINEQNKLFVNKTGDYHKNQPELDTTQVDWVEFEKDQTSGLVMENIINRLESLTTRLKSAKILHDYDNYQASLTDYGFTSFMAGTGAAGYETKMNEMKQFFLKPGSAGKPAGSAE